MSTQKIKDLKLEDYLNKHKISYTLYNHPAVFTVAESDKITKHIPGLRIKNLFLKSDSGKYYLVCLNGHKRLDLKLLKSKLNEKKIHFASPEELKEELNLTPGSVSMLGMINSIKTHLIVDEEVWSSKLIGLHPNINTATLTLENSQLKKFCKSLDKSFEVINLE
ncbi:hypothetical protein COU54_01845 [Candidatus Pacearchaeota archaeon CG10_big_fil_rev_8_21_14_0_10_31_24]|nr:MAG: hypothetical protein COU54_01845 [Candidatus Pacearchaeota archaeon CG10_big_fil_rev_8_21_14_0_10_31_24]